MQFWASSSIFMRVYNTSTHYPFSSPVPGPVFNAHSPLSSLPFSSSRISQVLFPSRVSDIQHQGQKDLFRSQFQGALGRVEQLLSWGRGSRMGRRDRLRTFIDYTFLHTALLMGTRHLKHGPAGPVSTQIRTCLGLSLQVQFPHRPEYF